MSWLNPINFFRREWRSCKETVAKLRNWRDIDVSNTKMFATRLKVAFPVAMALYMVGTRALTS